MLDKTMQIFVMNIEGKTVTIDVEPRDIIKTVKEKLQVNMLIVPYSERPKRVWGFSSVNEVDKP